MLKEIANAYYLSDNYNCAETIIRAANDFYSLGIEDRDMKMVAGFGAGIQSGNMCGAALAGVAVLSLKYVETKAHDSKEIGPLTNNLLCRFQKVYGSLQCRDIKPQSFSPEVRCRRTIVTACEALEQVIKEYDSGLIQ